MADDREKRAAVERRAWADDEVKVYPAGTPIPPPPADDEEDDEQ